MIKSIDTYYNGNYFRSRLEARWAVYFDLIGMPYQYEPEGYELDSGEKYLPDFYLPTQQMYVEVKPELNSSTEDNILCTLTKAIKLIVEKPSHFMVCMGVPKDHVIIVDYNSQISPLIESEVSLEKITEWVLNWIFKSPKAKTFAKTGSKAYYALKEAGKKRFEFEKAEKHIMPIKAYTEIETRQICKDESRKPMSALEQIRLKILKDNQDIKEEEFMVCWHKFIEELKHWKNPAWQSFQSSSIDLMGGDEIRVTCKSNIDLKFLEFERNKAACFLQKELQNHNLRMVISC